MMEFETERVREEWVSPELSDPLPDVFDFYVRLRWLVLGEATEIQCIKSTLDEDRQLKRKSSTHRTWRAIDSSIDQSRMDLEDLVRRIVNSKYPTHVRNMPRIAPLRHGTAPHAHLQATFAEARR